MKQKDHRPNRELQPSAIIPLQPHLLRLTAILMAGLIVAHSLPYSSLTRAMIPTVTELTLTCSDGLSMAAQVWSTAAPKNTEPTVEPTAVSTRRILCLHGWMDNCRSFHHFAPTLLRHLPGPTELVALDFPGHGWSSHKSLDGPPVLLAELAFYIAEAVRQLQWTTTATASSDSTTLSSTPFTLIGHSMGAAISCIYAAAYPEQIQKLVLLEGAGPLARNPEDIAKHIRQNVERRQLGNLSSKPPRVYESLQKAVETRCQTARNFPGNQYLSAEAATEMVVRGSRTVEGGLQFRHDPRLQWPSAQYFTNEQVEAVYKDIQCPTALLLSVDGWPFDEKRHGRTMELLKPTVSKTLAGSHHFHADPDTADAVVAAVAAFLQ